MFPSGYCYSYSIHIVWSMADFKFEVCSTVKPWVLTGKGWVAVGVQHCNLFTLILLARSQPFALWLGYKSCDLLAFDH